MNKILYGAALIAGLVSVCWVGLGYVNTNPLALLMCVVMGAFYLMGVLELRRFGQATTSLSQAVARADPAPAELGPWLAGIHPSLQSVVRLRIEGERVGMPGPYMTPYLIGLLVLLGMLGTFLGMVVTLKGTGLALESASDLQSVRDALSAPVKGLGLAFGTSVAGVAASAMLGLMSALRKSDRLGAGSALDECMASHLRAFSSSHQREQSLILLQQQAALLPQMLAELRTWTATQAQQGQHLHERLLHEQKNFYQQTETAYTGLAQSVAQSLQQSVGDSVRETRASIEPVVQATMAQLEQATSNLHHTITASVQRQLESLTTEFSHSSTRVAGLWTSALDEQKSHQQQVASSLQGALTQFTDGFEKRSVALVDAVGQRLDGVVSQVSEQWTSALRTQAHEHGAMTQVTREALTQAAGTFEKQSLALLDKIETGQAQTQSQQAANDQARLTAWTESLQSMATALQREWQTAGQHLGQQLQQFADTLRQTAGEVSTQTQAQAQATMAELAQLVQTVSDGPRAAAEVMSQLRQTLSDSMARDNTMLEERSRILGTMSELIDTMSRAAQEQRVAINELVANSTDLLGRTGERLSQTIDAHSDQMHQAHAQLTSSAAEVASLGEAFGVGVQLFDQSNEKLLAQLQRIEEALGQSMTRSNEQLDYYVAQAREVIDLSIGSQKHIVDELRQLARQGAVADSPA